MSDKKKISVNGINIDKINYNSLYFLINEAIKNNYPLSIGYANANTVNLSYSDKELITTMNTFDIIHPDGIGIYFASRFLFKENGLTERFTGSDFYPILWDKCISNKYRLFFFGHDDNTLEKIKGNVPGLNISGFNNGYSYNDNDVIQKINDSASDILIIGLSTPKQENWVSRNKGNLKCKVIICVGDGIKVFAGDKNRGPAILRKLGFEWFWRFCTNPVKYFKRYILGNPLFLYRIFSIKMRKLAS